MNVYFEKDKHVLSRVYFRYLDGYYSGRGILQWDPEKGFHLDALVDRDRPLPPKITFKMMTKRVIREDEFYSIRMKPHNYDWAIAPSVALYDRFDIVHLNHIGVNLDRVIFFNKLDKPAYKDKYHIHCLYGTGRIRIPTLPDQVNCSLSVNYKEIENRGYATGIYFETEKQKIIGYHKEDEYFELIGTFSKGHCSKSYPWNWAEGFERALSIYLGRTVRLLYREFSRDKNRYIEFRPKRKIIDLGQFRLFDELLSFNTESLVKFVNFFASKTDKSNVCANIFNQMVSAVQQPNYHARELLISTILEAIFRNLEKKPFGRKGKKISIKNSLGKFRVTYLSDQWIEKCDEISNIQKELRDRNAHPDWLYEKSGSLSENEIAKSFNDMIYLSRFYGYMILALAEFRDINPNFPARYDEE